MPNPDPSWAFFCPVNKNVLGLQTGTGICSQLISFMLLVFQSSGDFWLSRDGQACPEELQQRRLFVMPSIAIKLGLLTAIE
jgi:hypothetical protein